MTVEEHNSVLEGLREGLSDLPRADNHKPGQSVDADAIYTVYSHRSAIDLDRPLVVGNRGVGKSFWAHALAQEKSRIAAAQRFGRPELANTAVVIGYNASETEQVAPPPDVLVESLARVNDAEVVWRAIVVRATVSVVGAAIDVPTRFGELVEWVRADRERAADLMKVSDEQLASQRRRLLIVFDALDRLAPDWKTTRTLLRALLQRALGAQSYRAIRLKLFMRLDQFADEGLFAFPDGSKVQNTRVDLSWATADLYGLLFDRLRKLRPGEFAAVEELARRKESVFPFVDNEAKKIVDLIAGEFMGSDRKRGRVYTWLPLHLADAFGETSPRTFMTAWRESALHGSRPAGRVVDHLGILEGVRKASEDRLRELLQDYWWISEALSPLRGQMVPMERGVLEELWRQDGTAARIRASSSPGPAPNELMGGVSSDEGALLNALTAIGVMEIRTNGKINVPDIFRVEARIKRKGGVSVPGQRATLQH